MTKYNIPFSPPDITEEEIAEVADTLRSGWITTGPKTKELERRLSEYTHTNRTVCLNSATAALELILRVLEIGEGDEVIVPDITFAATINAVLYLGATPVIVDVEEDSWCMNPEEFEKAITSKTKAVIPVHIYGQPCDMGRIMEIADRHHVYVVEDCAEAHGAEYKNKKVGTFGIISCFSFFGNKIIYLYTQLIFILNN